MVAPNIISGLPPPLVIFNKSHSGSRVLAAALLGNGIFLGAELNESNDALPLVPLVEHLVERYYPDFSPLWANPWPPELTALATAAFKQHLAGYTGGPWGWKLCETGYILPVIDALFPDTRYIHLIRDGRDVALSDHVAPHNKFWRKIYFNTDRISSWGNRPLTIPAYLHASSLYNARHWANSVTVGRIYGGMLRARYLEVRYEDPCMKFEPVMHRILDFAQVEPDPGVLRAFAKTVNTRRLRKFDHAAPRRRRAVSRLIAPELAAFGYAEHVAPPLLARLRAMISFLWWRQTRRGF